MALLLSSPGHHLFAYCCSGSCSKTLMNNVIVRPDVIRCTFACTLRLSSWYRGWAIRRESIVFVCFKGFYWTVCRTATIWCFLERRLFNWILVRRVVDAELPFICWQQANSSAFWYLAIVWHCISDASCVYHLAIPVISICVYPVHVPHDSWELISIIENGSLHWNLSVYLKENVKKWEEYEFISHVIHILWEKK